jgi:hypothetical protein
MKDTHYSSKLSRSRKAQQSVHIYWKVFWDRVVADEAHFEVTLTSETIQLFKNKLKTQKWFLTDTLLSDHLLRWQVELRFLKQVVELSSRNTLCDQKRGALCKTLIMHCVLTLSDEKDAWSHCCWERNWLKYQELTHQITDWCTWNPLTQTKCNTISFLWQPLTQVIVNTHYVINCSLPTRYNELVNSLLMIITDQLKKEHAVAKVNWVDNSHIGLNWASMSTIEWWRCDNSEFWAAFHNWES